MFSTAAEKQALFRTFSAKGPKYLRFFGETLKFLSFGRKNDQFSAKQFVAAGKWLIPRPFGEKRLKKSERNRQNQLFRTEKGIILYGMSENQTFRTGNEPILYGASKIRQFVQEKAKSCTKRSC